jgi:hypothetical protein
MEEPKNIQILFRKLTAAARERDQLEGQINEGKSTRIDIIIFFVSDIVLELWRQF